MSYATVKRGRMAGDQFTQIHNQLFRDPRLSAKAKGVFGFISTHRDGYGVTPEMIARHMKDGVSAIRGALQELERYGYLYRERERRSDGTLGGVTYFITDQPEQAPQAPADGPDEDTSDRTPATSGNPQTPRSEPNTDFPHVDSPDLENRQPKKTNTKEDQEELEDDEALTRAGAPAVRRTSDVGNRDARGRAAGGRAAKKPAKSKPLDGKLPHQRVPIRPILEAVGPDMRDALPKSLPLEVYSDIAAELEQRTIEQLAARTGMRWYTQRWAEKHDRGEIRSYVAALRTMIQHGKCANLRCDDGWDVDHPAKPCGFCNEGA